MMNAKLFDKYPYQVEVRDRSLGQYIAFPPVTIPHTFARHANTPFAKSRLNLVERLANKLMRGGTGEKLSGKVIRTHGRLQGKKTKVLKIIEEAFDDVAKRTNGNPVQAFVRALENAAPREETTRVRFGGISYQIATDISASRRLDLALRNIALAAILSSFGGKISLAAGLANEIELASKGDPNSYAIKRKNEAERMAKSAR
jgi:small subunit ribosomal protein S7